MACPAAFPPGMRHHGEGWDARVHQLPPATRLTLDRARWSVDEAQDTVPFRPGLGSEREQVARLRAAVQDACRRFDVPWETWRVALSGGMDSRGIVLGLVRAGKRPATVTWGQAAARRDYRNDAVIAPLVA